MNKKKHTHLFYGGEEATALLKMSRERLMEADCDDFMVYRVLDGTNVEKLEKEHLEDWIGPIRIDENTHLLLHLNLCQKVKRNFSRKSAPKTSND
ncbi:hypothetical protein [Flagellimonas flava]|uniref:hypothetical protein n=1 Tax=Flagellimonas TaxID=444459 RepID=UPI003D649092